MTKNKLEMRIEKDLDNESLWAKNLLLETGQKSDLYATQAIMGTSAVTLCAEQNFNLEIWSYYFYDAYSYLASHLFLGGWIIFTINEQERQANPVYPKNTKDSRTQSILMPRCHMWASAASNASQVLIGESGWVAFILDIKTSNR